MFNSISSDTGSYVTYLTCTNPGPMACFSLGSADPICTLIFPISLLNKGVPINFCLAGQRESRLSVPLLFTGDIHSLRKFKVKSFLLMLFLCSFPSSHVLFSFHNLDPQVEFHRSLDRRMHKNLWILCIHQNTKEIVCHLLKAMWFSTSQTLIKAKKI